MPHRGVAGAGSRCGGRPKPRGGSAVGGHFPPHSVAALGTALRLGLAFPASRVTTDLVHGDVQLHLFPKNERPQLGRIRVLIGAIRLIVMLGEPSVHDQFADLGSCPLILLT